MINSRLTALVVLCAALSGCGGGGQPSAAVVEVVTAVIGPSGGSLVHTRGQARVDVPAGALAADAELSLAVVPGLPPSPPGLRAVGAGYRLGPTDLSFGQPATLTIAFTQQDLAASGVTESSAVRLVVLGTGGRWAVDPQATLNTQAATVLTQTTGAGTFRLAAAPRSLPRLAFAQGSDTNGDGIANEADNFDIYLTDEAGGSVEPLSPDLGWDGEPRWSPDGQRIAFVSTRFGRRTLFLAGADGFGARPISAHSVLQASWYEWSPTGDRIAYTAGAPGAAQVRAAAADGSGDLLLASGADPTWSPDAEEIAVSQAGAVVVVQTATGATRLLTHGHSPRWSPTGQLIALVSDREGFDAVYVIGKDGRGEVRLAEGSEPSWSPDGQHVVIASRSGLIIAAASGDSLQPLGLLGRSPRWSPDGGLIAFHSSRDGTDNVYTVLTTGADLRQITRSVSPAGSIRPDWGPGQ